MSSMAATSQVEEGFNALLPTSAFSDSDGSSSDEDFQGVAQGSSCSVVRIAGALALAGGLATVAMLSRAPSRNHAAEFMGMSGVSALITEWQGDACSEACWQTRMKQLQECEPRHANCKQAAKKEYKKCHGACPAKGKGKQGHGTGKDNDQVKGKGEHSHAKGKGKGKERGEESGGKGKGKAKGDGKGEEEGKGEEGEGKSEEVKGKGKGRDNECGEGNGTACDHKGKGTGKDGDKGKDKGKHCDGGKNQECKHGDSKGKEKDKGKSKGSSDDKQKQKDHKEHRDSEEDAEGSVKDAQGQENGDHESAQDALAA